VQPVFYANLARSDNWFEKIVDLSQFRRGGVGVNDAQAAGASPAYANYLFGVFMSASGYSLSDTLQDANWCAAFRSRYPSGTVMDPNYSSIPTSNVANISLGWNAEKNGNVCHY
jgi:hypothetical protein